MVLLNKYRITPYERGHRRAVADLLFYSRFAQTHLDWQDINDWLSSEEQGITVLAWQDDDLVGVMATSAPLQGTVWMRLVGVEDIANPIAILQPMWEEMRDLLREEGVTLVTWLVIEKWQLAHLPTLGFAYFNEVVTLRRVGYDLPQHPRPVGLRIRSAESADVSAMLTVDHAAFAPVWRNTLDEIRQGRRVAAIASVAEFNGNIAGYQLSTLYQQNAHLARLAVSPDYHGQGIGGALLTELITYFLRKRIRSVTVNTQGDNVQSLRLYRLFGFERNGYDLPVWACHL